MYVLFDIGGTKTRVAISDDLHTFKRKPLLFNTPESFDELTVCVSQAIKYLVGTEQIHGAAGGMKGTFNSNTGRIMRVPGREGWADQPLAERLAPACGRHPIIMNDTAMVGLGEAHFGAGKGSRILAYVTVSTGVGGVRIVDGKIDIAHVGFEPGHQIIDFDGNMCKECNARSHIGVGRLEEYVGGAALKQRTGLAPHDITDPGVWEEEARRFAMGLHNITVLWSPDTIVLGGSMIEGIKGPGISVDATARHLKDLLWIFPEPPVIKKATLDDFGGLYGAMALLKGST